jgi:hypothetical protein
VGGEVFRQGFKRLLVVSQVWSVICGGGVAFFWWGCYLMLLEKHLRESVYEVR